MDQIVLVCLRLFRAQFDAEIYKTETGYEARGPLTIRDQTLDVVLPFSLDIQGETAKMSGTMDLNRLDFGVGQSMPKEDSLAFGVTVSVNLTATRSAE